MKALTADAPRAVGPTGGEVARVNDLLARIERLDTRIAAAQAKRMLLVAQLAAITDLQTRRALDARLGDEENGIPHRAMVEELAAATTVSSYTAERQLFEAVAITETYPAVHDRLMVGNLSLEQARVFVAAGEDLDVEQRRRFEHELLTKLTQLPMTPAQLRPVAQHVAQRLNPIPLSERHTAARRRRDVTYVPAEDGMGTLRAFVPAVLGIAIRDRLTAMGKQMRSARFGTHDEQPPTDLPQPVEADGWLQEIDPSAADRLREQADARRRAEQEPPADPWASDTRSLGELRTDVFCDLLLAGAPSVETGATADGLGSVRATVQVTIPTKTLTDLSDDAAFLAGHGPVDADTARRLASGETQWHRLFLHPGTGALLTVDQYRPSQRQRHFLGARDEVCRFPGCRQPARQSDLDHTRDYADGGETDVGNLEALCRRHHTVKHNSMWCVAQLRDGVLRFTSPAGRVYIQSPAPGVRFVAVSDDEPAPF